MASENRRLCEDAGHYGRGDLRLLVGTAGTGGMSAYRSEVTRESNRTGNVEEALVKEALLMDDVPIRAESHQFLKQFFACDSARLSQTSK